MSLTKGGIPGTLTATIEPGDVTNKEVTWSSSKEEVATVDGIGLSATITPVDEGK